MPFRFHNPSAVAAPSGNYAHGLEVPPAARYLFISGQIPSAEENDIIPDTFEAQCEAVWGNLIAILASANMTVANLVKVTTFLTHRDQASANSHIRQQVLGTHTPALTVIIAQTLDSAWLLEIEAIAADAP